MPELRPLGVDAGGGGALAHAQASVLIGTQELPEFGIVVARQAPEPASGIAPQHRDAADQRRVRRQPIGSDRQIIQRRGAHEILTEPGAQPAGPDALLAGALRTQMNKTNWFEIDALGDPAEHVLGWIAES